MKTRLEKEQLIFKKAQNMEQSPDDIEYSYEQQHFSSPYEYSDGPSLQMSQKKKQQPKQSMNYGNFDQQQQQQQQIQRQQLQTRVQSTGNDLSPIRESHSSSMMTGSRPSYVTDKPQQQKQQINQQQYGQVSPTFKNAKEEKQKKQQDARFSMDSRSSNMDQLSQQQLRKMIENLFVYYCDYSLDKGLIFIKQANIVKLLKDSKVLPDQRLNEKELTLILSQETNNPQLKTLDFQSFLNLLVKIALIKYQNESDCNPKKAMEILLSQNVLPLLNMIENTIKGQSSISSLTESGQYISNISIETLQSIKVSEEDLVIIKSIIDSLRAIYDYYFPWKEQKEPAMKRLFRLLKDFEICPYLINQKTCFMIYYFSAVSQMSQSQILEDIEKFKLSPSKMNTKVQSKQKQNEKKIDHPQLSFNSFLSILYRISIIFFDMSYTGQYDIKNSKKLLSMLTRIELAQGFSDFLGHQRQFKSLTIQYQLTPPKNILVQLYLNQQVFNSQDELEYVRDVVLQDYDCYQIGKMIMEEDEAGKIERYSKISQNQQNINKSQNELEAYLDNVNDSLLKLFQYYCSYGDPLNIEKLKSSKLMKMITEAQLIQENNDKLSKDMSFQSKRPVSTLFQRKLSSSSQIQQQENNCFIKIQKKDIDLIFKKFASQKSTQHNFLVLPSNYSQSSSRSTQKFRTPQKESSLYGLSNGKSKIIKTVEVSLDQNSINFQEFKAALLEISKIVTRIEGVNEYEACIYFINEKIMPLATISADDRGIQTKKISEMATQMEDQQVIQILGDLHIEIGPIFEVYSNHRGHMVFEQFIKFCTDFSIYPDLLNKSDAHRIFMNLAFITQDVSRFQDMQYSRSKDRSIFTSSLDHRLGQSRMSSSRDSQYTSKTLLQQQQMQQIQVIDIHLFVEALGFCALHIDTATTKLILPKEQEAVEKILLLIEKLSVSDGLKRSKQKKLEDKIKTIAVEKVDVMAFFRKKYSWYFKAKQQENQLERQLKVQNSAFKNLTIMDSITKSNLIQEKSTNRNINKKQQQKTDLFSMVFAEQF